jgi:hypothetical protein
VDKHSSLFCQSIADYCHLAYGLSADSRSIGDEAEKGFIKLTPDSGERKGLRPRSGSARRTRRRLPDILPDPGRFPALGRVALEDDDAPGELLFFGESGRGRRGPQVDVPVNSGRELRALELRGRRHAPDAHRSFPEWAERQKGRLNLRRRWFHSVASRFRHSVASRFRHFFIF